MQKRCLIIVLLFGLIGIGTSSCFELVETVTLEADGSGTVKYKFNLSQSKMRMGSVLLLDSIRGYKVPSIEEVKTKLFELEEKLGSKDGIQRASVKQNWEEYIFELAIHFENIPALNNALKQVSESDKWAKEFFFSPYVYDGKRFEKKSNPNASTSITEHISRNKDWLEQAQYIAVFRFSKSVVNQTNADYSLSKSGKAVLFRASFLDLVDQKLNPKNSILLQ